MDVDESVRVTFKYYLNPDGTRNVEFDRQRNLFLKTETGYKDTSSLPHKEWMKYGPIHNP
jgi:hypothetical protein